MHAQDYEAACWVLQMHLYMVNYILAKDNIENRAWLQCEEEDAQ